MLQLLPDIKHTNEHMKITKTVNKQTNSHKHTCVHMHTPSLLQTLDLLQYIAHIKKATVY
jgi:hypothetical protein